MSESPWHPFERPWSPSIDSEDRCDFFALTYNIYHEDTISATDEDEPYLKERPELISSTFRNDMIIKEIELWCPDVVALQEMDVGYFGSQWLPRMASLGYAGHLAVPSGAITRGSVAVFYNLKTFELKHVECRPMEGLINEQLPDLMDEFILLRDPRIEGRVANFVRLKHKSTKREIQFACIHFLWTDFEYPLHQCLEVLATLRKVKQLAKNDAFIILGDFNHLPSDPQYELLRTGQVSATSESQFSSEIAKAEKLLKAFVREKLRHDLSIRSSFCEVIGSEPEFTTYSYQGRWYTDTLDYIWYSTDRKLKVTSVMTMPSKEAVTKYGGIPSPIFPSDHLPMGARFKLE